MPTFQSVSRTRNYVIIQVMDNVRDRLYRCEYKDGKFSFKIELVVDGTDIAVVTTGVDSPLPIYVPVNSSPSTSRPATSAGANCV